MSKTIEQAEADLASANAAYLEELRQDSQRSEGSGAQERRREEHQQSLRDAISQCEQDLEETKRRAAPTIEAVKALDGRIFAMLNASELDTLEFYRAQGRKFGVAVSIINKADPSELALARSQSQADEIMKRANSLISVTVQ